MLTSSALNLTLNISAMQTNKTSIAIIGAGFWGEKLIRNFSNLETCHIKYVCDLDERRLTQVKSDYPNVERVTSEFGEILADREVKGVVIATPANSHFELARQSLASGKHILLEKPMAASVEDCRKLIALAQGNNLHILVDHTFLYAPAIQYLRDLVAAGELGQPYYFTAERFNPRTATPDVNVIWDLAIHNIAIMRDVFAPRQAESVLAYGSKYVNDKELEIGHVFVRFAGGIVGHIQVNWLTPFKSNKFVVGGSKKMVLFDNNPPRDKLSLINVSSEKDSQGKYIWPIYKSDEEPVVPHFSDEEPLLIEAKHFIDCTNGNDKPRVSGQDGLEVVRIMQACDQSIASGQIVNL